MHVIIFRKFFLRKVTISFIGEEIYIRYVGLMGENLTSLWMIKVLSILHVCVCQHGMDKGLN